MKRIEKRLKIEDDDAKKLQTMLKSSEPLDDVPRYGTYQVFTVDFGDGVEADIKLCGADDQTLFIDPVLFYQGREVCVLDVVDELLGEYVFEYNNVEYVAILE